MKKFLTLVFILFCDTAFAQTETIKWYIGNTLYDTTTCESGGNINTPNVPEKFGYTFQGWEPAIYDMSTLDASINGEKNGYGKNWSGKFSYGTINGVALCSPTPKPSNSYIADENLDTETGVGLYCWCKILTFVPTNSDKVYEPNSLHWTFNKSCASTQYCASWCGDHCVSDLVSKYAVRSIMYGTN